MAEISDKTMYATESNKKSHDAQAMPKPMKARDELRYIGCLE
jgi:hypothetical protein